MRRNLAMTLGIEGKGVKRNFRFPHVSQQVLEVYSDVEFA